MATRRLAAYQFPHQRQLRTQELTTVDRYLAYDVLPGSHTLLREDESREGALCYLTTRAHCSHQHAECVSDRDNVYVREDYTCAIPCDPSQCLHDELWDRLGVKVRKLCDE